MKFNHITKKNRGVFTVAEDEQVVGIMTYMNMDKTCFIVDHTEVEPEYEGKGLGTALIQEAVKYARESNRKILPLCPFVKSYFKNNKSSLKEVEYDEK